jgi:hypothetical protein
MGVFHFEISMLWFRVIRVLFYVIWTLLFFTRCAEDSRVWIISLYLKNFMEKETRAQEMPKWSKTFLEAVF